MKPDSRSLGLGDMPDDQFLERVNYALMPPSERKLADENARLKDQLAEAQSHLGKLGDQNRRLIETQVADAQEIARLREKLESATEQRDDRV